MIRLLPICLILLGLSAVIACNDDDATTPTPPPGEGTPVATQLAEAATQAPESTSAPSESGGGERPAQAPTVEGTQRAGDIGVSAIARAYYEPPRPLHEVCGTPVERQCVAGYVIENSDSPDVGAFYQWWERFLTNFWEYGVVDFGTTSRIDYNMGRPEPAFLNGGFGVLYVGTLVPEDWKEEPSIAYLPESTVVWPEYSTVTEATSSLDGQRFVVEVPLQECRACPRLGSLPLEVLFNAQGSAAGVTVTVNVLPFRPR